MSALEVIQLKKSYGSVTVVDNLSFCVEKGEIFGLIGPNGAGKSTTMMMIVGLLKADTGKILLDGVNFNPRNPDMRAQFGVVPQELAIYPDLTAVENLRFFGRLYGLQGARLQERVDEVLTLIGLAKHANQSPSTFSGGMSRRLNFGIALLHEPTIVILDEPTVGIDPQSRANLLDCVRHLSERGVAVIYASHYIDEVEAVCHRVAIMDHGRLLKHGTLDEIIDRSRDEIHVTVPPLSADLLARIRETAEVRTNAAENMTIVLTESLVTNPERRTERLRDLLQLLEKSGVVMLGINSKKTSLETLFLSLTGRTLRD